MRPDPRAEPIVRACEAADADGIAALVNLPGVRHGTARLPYTSRAEVERRLQADADAHRLVAELDGEIVGQAGLHPYRGRRAHAAGVGVMVHDDCVGHGIGTALLAALIELADQWLGLRRLELTVNVDNARAIRLYERFGFEREGLKRAEILRGAELIDCLLMSRLRGPPRRAHAPATGEDPP